MKVAVEAARDDRFETSGWSSDNWLTILHALRKELRAASAVFPELKDYVIERPQAPQAPPAPPKKRGK